MQIRKRKYPSGKVRWQLDLGYIDGKRRKELFDTKEQATSRLTSARVTRRAVGDAGLTLSDADRVLFTQARDQLATIGATITEAVAFYIAAKRPAREPLPLGAVFNLCLEEKKNLGKSPHYLRQLRCSCLSFVRGREHVPTHEVRRQQVEEWIHGNQWKAKTQRVYLGDLRTLFAFAVSKGYALANPCQPPAEEGGRIQLAKMVASPIHTLTASQAERLLKVAARVPESEEEPDFRPLLTYTALGLFCGIRPAELDRLDRSAVRRTERLVIVEAHQAKNTRSRRVVDISENCRDWLALDPVLTGKITPRNFRRQWARLRMAAGWRPQLQALSSADSPPDPSLPKWPHDVMRHTFASMHYAAHQNESLLKAQMGHSEEEDVLFRHYRAIKTRGEAEAFWSIRPTKAAAAPDPATPAPPLPAD